MRELWVELQASAEGKKDLYVPGESLRVSLRGPVEQGIVFEFE